MDYLFAFLAGFIATLTFHQGMLFVLHKGGLWPKPPFPMARTRPFGIPAVFSLALWGGVWGVLLWLVVRNDVGTAYWVYATLFGAILPSIVALFIVFPMKGLPPADGGNPKVIIPVLVLNGAWGFGTALLMRVLAI